MLMTLLMRMSITPETSVLENLLAQGLAGRVPLQWPPPATMLRQCCCCVATFTLTTRSSWLLRCFALLSRSSAAPSQERHDTEGILMRSPGLAAPRRRRTADQDHKPDRKEEPSRMAGSLRSERALTLRTNFVPDLMLARSAFGRASRDRPLVTELLQRLLKQLDKH